jgi:hypothetical protein
VFVWNEIQRREAVELHGMRPEGVSATGAGLFDTWFDRRPSTSREEFVRRMGLDPELPYLLFVGSSPFVTNHSDAEVRFVERWIERSAPPATSGCNASGSLFGRIRSARAGATPTSPGTRTPSSGRATLSGPSRQRGTTTSTTRSPTAPRSSGSTRRR